MSTRKLGKYLMLETLGQGGFSKVRLGLDEQTGERVALKILKKSMTGVTADVIKQVEREIHAMSRIAHANVIRLKDVNWDCTYEKKNGTKLQVILVVLELATGGELFDFLAFTGPFEEAIARTYFQQLIGGLSHCHQAGLAHRDIKPENLLLSSSFELKIADFGFASTFGSAQNSASQMHTVCGTQGYMAPEVFASTSRGYDGAAADLWSAGVVLFIQLAGFPPFQRPALNDWWFNKLSNNKHHLFWEAHQRTAYFSDVVKDFLNKLLCPDVSKRMTMSELVRHPFMLGATISHTALQSELMRRKQTVDESKMRERAEKASKVVGADGCGSGAVPAQAGLLERGDVSMTRGEAPMAVIDYASEALPPSVPSITAFGKGVAADARVGDGHAAGAAGEAAKAPKGATMTADAFSFAEGGEGGEVYEPNEGEDWGDAYASSAPAAVAAPVVVAAPVAPLFALHTQSFTRFSTGTFAAASDLLRTLVASLQDLGCTVSSSEAKFKISRAKCVTAQGVLEFSVSLYRDPRSEEHIVDFRKLAGDSAQWRVLYAEMRYKLRDLISQHPSETLRLVDTAPQQQQ